jgi:hypothetical protein
MFLASQGVFGPVVEARQLKPGERVLFKLEPQPVYGLDGGAVKGCAAPARLDAASGPFADGWPAALSAPVSGMAPALVAMLLLAAWAARRRTTVRFA